MKPELNTDRAQLSNFPRYTLKKLDDISLDLYGDGIGKVQLVNHWGDDKMCVNAARVSFGQDDEGLLTKKDKKLVKYLVKHKHTSVFEHCGITCKFIVPLFVRSQHHRHRTWSYNEISRRYTDKDIQFYEPKEFRTQHKSNRQASNENDRINPAVGTGNLYLASKMKASALVKEHHKHCLKLFNNMLEEGICREQARGVLPQNMYTEYYGSVSLLNLLKFIDLRIHEGAQWEIVKVAEALLEIASELWPEVVLAWKEAVA
tara:strand:+ start:1548 stop:2327 length:780 start_codon:yes stop_codon:yes gene_type:complete